MHNLNFKLILMLILSLFAVGIIAQADTTDEPRLVYYMAADSDGIQQVYQLLIDGNNDARQISFAQSNVITFGVAYDGLSIAYVSASQLWLQPIHTDEAIALAPLTATQFFAEPIYSPDGQYIAYADKGVWLLDLASRETQQILMDVPIAEDGSNMADYRIYLPKRFLVDGDGLTTQLQVFIGIWEWRTSGIYDIETGEVLELEGQIHMDFLPLSDGTVLVYGNSGVGGESTLSLAPNLVGINNHTPVLDFNEVTDATLFAEQAIEIAPNTVRIYGTALEGLPATISSFYFDYNVATDEATEIQFISLPESTTGSTITLELSPDAVFVPVYVDALWTDNGSIYGDLFLRNIVTGEDFYTFPETTSIFNWQQ